MMEGAIVDVLVFMFRMDYADRRSTAIVYAWEAGQAIGTGESKG